MGSPHYHGNYQPHPAVMPQITRKVRAANRRAAPDVAAGQLQSAGPGEAG